MFNIPADRPAHDDFLAECLVRGSRAEVDWTFNLAQAKAPVIVWSPKDTQLVNPLIIKFAEICRNRSRAPGRLFRSDIEMADFGTLADWIMEVTRDDGDSFTYAHYGRGIASHYGHDMTGLSTAHFGEHISQFFGAVYRASARRREWVLTEHEPPKQILVLSWRRLIVPVLAEDGAVSGFLAINIPENALRAGLEIVPDPVFVADGSQIIRYSNAAAQTMFAPRGPIHVGRPLEEVLGCPVRLELTPDEMFERGSVTDQVAELSLGSSLTDDVLLTASGFTHGGRSFYVVIVKMLVPQVNAARCEG